MANGIICIRMCRYTSDAVIILARPLSSLSLHAASLTSLRQTELSELNYLIESSITDTPFYYGSAV